MRKLNFTNQRLYYVGLVEPSDSDHELICRMLNLGPDFKYSKENLIARAEALAELAREMMGKYRCDELLIGSRNPYLEKALDKRKLKWSYEVRAE